MKSVLTFILRFFSSLQLTLVLLGFSLILIFLMTLNQVEIGIHGALAKYIESWFVVWEWPELWAELPFPAGIPIPGGFLLGSVLLVNLICAHITRFKLSLKKIGIQAIHLGIMVLLIGEGVTRFFAVETIMTIREGETQVYSFTQFDNELVILDQSDPALDRLTSFPQAMVSQSLESGEPLTHETIPFQLRVLRYYPNAPLGLREANPSVNPGFITRATRGIGVSPQMVLLPREVTYAEDQTNTATAEVEVIGPDGSLGIWLLSNLLDSNETEGVDWPPQTFEYDGKSYEISFRFRRDYKGFKLFLHKFTFDRYPGTDRPRDYRSRVQLIDTERNENREVDIFMNNPLRYEGYTFYQMSFAPDEAGTVFQVVKNPGILLPYIAFALLTFGLLYHFIEHSFRRVKVVQ